MSEPVKTPIEGCGCGVVLTLMFMWWVLGRVGVPSNVSTWIVVGVAILLGVLSIHNEIKGTGPFFTKCPSCLARNYPGATKCQHCGEDIEIP